MRGFQLLMRGGIPAVVLGALLLSSLASAPAGAAPSRTMKAKSDTLVWKPAPTGRSEIAPQLAPSRAPITKSRPRPTPAPAPALAPLPAPAVDRSGSEWYSRASRDYDRDRFDDAGEAYERAALAGHHIATAYYNAACSYALAGRHDRALAMLEAAVRSGWDDADMLQSDDDLDSIRGDVRFREILARARDASGDESDRRSATAQYEALSAAGSKDADEWGDVGVDLMHSGEAGRAVIAFENQIRLEPGSNAAYNLACAHALNGDPDHALEALDRAIAGGYGDADHMREDHDLASLRGLRRFDELVRLTENLELNPGNLGDNEPLGWGKQLPRYERVAQLYPAYGRAWFNLGYAQLRSRRFEQSRASFGRALELRYRPATTMYDMACVIAQLRQGDEAVHWLERAEAEGMNLGFYLATDRDLDPIRSSARFRAMLRRVQDDQWDKGRLKLKQGFDKLGRALDRL